MDQDGLGKCKNIFEAVFGSLDVFSLYAAVVVFYKWRYNFMPGPPRSSLNRNRKHDPDWPYIAQGFLVISLAWIPIGIWLTLHNWADSNWWKRSLWFLSLLIPALGSLVVLLLYYVEMALLLPSITRDPIDN
jgi:hypothetical protein